MNITKASSADAQTIAKYQVELAKETENLQLDSQTVSLGVQAVFSDSSKGQYWVVKEDQKVIGSLLITLEWSDWRNGTVWWIQSVYILPEFRGKGVFKQMYETIKAKVMADDNLRGLRLYVDKTNTKAISVYEKIGMTAEHYSLYEWLK